MARDGWGTTQDEGTIIYIDKDRPSKNGPFTIFKLRDKVTGEVKRIQAWGQAYQDLKNGLYFVGSSVCVPGWVHYYIDANNSRQVRVKTDSIYPQGGTIRIRLRVTSEWYKGESIEKGIHGFSGTAIAGDEKIKDTLVVRCFMPKTNVLWRKVKKDGVIDVCGIYHIEEEEIGSRIVIDNIYDIMEVDNG